MKAKYSSSPRVFAYWPDWAGPTAAPSRRWRRCANTWPRSTALSCCIQALPITISTWAKSHPTHPVTKKTAASSATPTRGSWQPKPAWATAIRRTTITCASIHPRVSRSVRFTEANPMSMPRRSPEKMLHHSAKPRIPG